MMLYPFDAEFRKYSLYKFVVFASMTISLAEQTDSEGLS